MSAFRRAGTLMELYVQLPLRLGSEDFDELAN